MGVTIRWYGPSVLDLFRRRMEGRVRESAELVAAHMRELVGVSYPPASVPGTPPHLRTGNLRDSIRAEVARGGFGFGRYYGRVVVGADYAGYLEHGTSKMGARPFAARALAEKKVEVEQIMKARI